jgi:hypothetical protein
MAIFKRLTFALAACLLLAACETRVQVDATSVVAARYTRVLVTVKAIWFNESATAVPADETWQKFDLDDTVTLDLVGLTDGTVETIARQLKVPVGTYRQIRMFLASRDEDLHDSADDLDADYNNEVSWFDEEGDEQTRPLEVLNADQGIGIELELKVKESISAVTTVQVLFDAARDLTEFRYSDETGFLLNPTLQAFDPTEVGAMRGVVILTQLGLAGTDRPDIQVTAQRLDEDLNRWVVVGNAAVSRTGSFVLYPLPLDEEEDITKYDLVIHGPGIQTIVIRDAPVSEDAPGSATLLAALIAPVPADSFEADIDENNPVVQRGARIGFYQTLPGEDEPHLVHTAAVDPLSGRFAEPVKLSRASTIAYATYGVDLQPRSGTPEEGASRYAVAALSPHYGNGALAETTLRPASSAADTAQFSVPAIGLPAAAVPGTIQTTLTIDNPGRYDRGVLMVTQDGAVVAAVSLDDVLVAPPPLRFVDVTPVPAGTTSANFDRGLYYLEAWTWDSGDPEDTFTRHAGAAAVDLRASATATGSVTID